MITIDLTDTDLVEILAGGGQGGGGGGPQAGGAAPGAAPPRPARPARVRGAGAASGALASPASPPSHARGAGAPAGATPRRSAASGGVWEVEEGGGSDLRTPSSGGGGARAGGRGAGRPPPTPQRATAAAAAAVAAAAAAAAGLGYCPEVRGGGRAGWDAAGPGSGADESRSRPCCDGAPCSSHAFLVSFFTCRFADRHAARHDVGCGAWGPRRWRP
jgi:hypothetical protein